MSSPPKLCSHRILGGAAVTLFTEDEVEIPQGVLGAQSLLPPATSDLLGRVDDTH